MSNVTEFPRGKAPGAAYPTDAAARIAAKTILDMLAGDDVAYRGELEAFADKYARLAATGESFSIEAPPEVAEAVQNAVLVAHATNLMIIRDLAMCWFDSKRRLGEW